MTFIFTHLYLIQIYVFVNIDDVVGITYKDTTLGKNIRIVIKRVMGILRPLASHRLPFKSVRGKRKEREKRESRDYPNGDFLSVETFSQILEISGQIRD